jgi:hypothetical protein
MMLWAKVTGFDFMVIVCAISIVAVFVMPILLHFFVIALMYILHIIYIIIYNSYGLAVVGFLVYAVTDEPTWIIIFAMMGFTIKIVMEWSTITKYLQSIGKNNNAAIINKYESFKSHVGNATTSINHLVCSSAAKKLVLIIFVLIIIFILLYVVEQTIYTSSQHSREPNQDYQSSSHQIFDPGIISRNALKNQRQENLRQHPSTRINYKKHSLGF